jgi:hypothetical protein
MEFILITFERPWLLKASNLNDKERNLKYSVRRHQSVERTNAHFNVLSVLIGYHHFYDKVMDMWWNRLLADMFY